MKTTTITCQRPRNGFTLVELLIVITIMLVLMTITVLSVNYVQDSERISGAARQVQSFLAGARDRAIHYRRPIGVRFFLDSDDNPRPGNGERRTVSALAMIDPGRMWEQGEISLYRLDRNLDGLTDAPSGAAGDVDLDGDGNRDIDVNGDSVPDDPTSVWMVRGDDTNLWWQLKRRGLLIDGMRIRIPAGPHGDWYPVDTRLINLNAAPPRYQFLLLLQPMDNVGNTDKRVARAFQDPQPDAFSTYELELPPTILPNEPSLLPESVVLDLDGSRLPAAWRPSAQNGGNFSPFMDIIFSPRGNVMGEAASNGVIHFYICDKRDATSLKDAFIDNLAGSRAVGITNFESGVSSGTPFVPAGEIDPGTTATPWVSPLSEEEPYGTGERRIVTVFTQTGGITVHPVNPTDVLDPTDLDGDSVFAEPDGLADDPYLFAETGEEAN